MKTGDLCMVARKGDLRLAAVMKADGDRLKLAIEESGRLVIVWRNVAKVLPVVAGTNAEELERLKQTIHERITYLKMKL